MERDAIRFKNVIITDIGRDPLPLIEKSVWFTRGWTYQEGFLSRRMLVFTDDQMSYHCRTASWKEGIRGPECIQHPQTIDWNRWPVTIFDKLFSQSARDWTTYCPKSLQSYGNYYSLVRNYSRRQLSRRSDYLNAFSGILAHLRQLNPPCYNSSGIPYYPCENTPENIHIFAALSWYIERRGSKRERRGSTRRKQHPSWTWLDWDGEIGWAPAFNRHTSCCSTFRFKGRVEPSIQDRDSHSGTEQVRQQDDIPRHLGAICMDVPIIPLSYYVDDRGRRLIDGADSWGGFSHFQIGDKMFLDAVASPMHPSIEVQFPWRILDKTWACCLLGRLQLVGKSRTAFVLLIEWLDGEIGQRLHAMLLSLMGPGLTGWGDFGDIEAGWDVRSVTLI